MQKALWYVSFAPAATNVLLEHVKRAGADLVCIRTTSPDLPTVIGELKQRDLKVYAWRWPAVQEHAPAPHYYAVEEAKFVVDHLIRAGLDGYIVDPESDKPGDPNDWNDSTLAGLARQFCSDIRSAAPNGFHFGTTSGCEYPTNHAQIPWKEFVDASDALYPQTYWRMTTARGNTDIHGGTPQKAYSRGIKSWQAISGGKPLVAIGGELACVTPDEIRSFGAQIAGKQEVAHFYVDSQGIPNEVLDAIAEI
jgi:hypothetical protein